MELHSKPQRAPAGVTLTSKSQAIRIKSEMRRTEQSKSSEIEWIARIHKGRSAWNGTLRDGKGDWVRGEVLWEGPSKDLPSPMERQKKFGWDVEVWNYRERRKGTAIATTEGDRLKEFYSRPAHFETILDHLTRMAGHLHLKGDQEQKDFLLSDAARRLAEKNATEIAVFFAVEWFIENQDDGFFPTFAKLHKQIFGKTDKATEKRERELFL